MWPYFAPKPLRGGASKGSGAWFAYAKPRRGRGVKAHPAFAGHAYAWTRNAKEDWLLQIRIGNRANDASRVAGSDREGGDIFGNDGAGTENNADF